MVPALRPTAAILACLAAAALAAEPASPPAARAENRWCPVTGRRVDPALAPVRVEVPGSGVQLVGVAEPAAAEVIARANDRQRRLFAEAARQRSRVEGGRLVRIGEADEQERPAR